MSSSCTSTAIKHFWHLWSRRSFFRPNNRVLSAVQAGWNEIISVTVIKQKHSRYHTVWEQRAQQIFSLPIGLKTCLKIHSVTKNWIRPASQIKILDLWQKALDGNSSALRSRHSGYLVASDGNYLQQRASVQFCMPCGVALLTLSFQKAERGNSTHTAFWHKEEKSIDAKRVCNVSGFLQRWKRF